MRKTAELFILMTAVATLAAAASNGTKPAAAPAAIVVHVEGKPQVTHDKATTPCTMGRALVTGDVVKCPEKSRVTLFLADASKLVVDAGKSVTIKAGSVQDKDSAERWKRLVATVLPTLKNQKYAVPGAPAVRGKDDPSVPPLDAVQPREFSDEDGRKVTGRVLNNAPVFVFTPLANVRSYRLRITVQGEPLVDRALTEREVIDDSERTGVLIARPEVGVLPAGTLRWQIIAGNAGTSQTRLNPFRAVDPGKEASLDNALRAMPAGEELVKQLMRAAIFESEEFFGDAIACYVGAIRADPEEALYHRLLARLYDRMEMFALADRELAAIKRPAN